LAECVEGPVATLKGERILVKVLLIAKKFDTYSTRRLIEALEARNHTVGLLSPLECALRIDRGCFDIIHPDTAISTPDFALLRCTAYSDFGVTVGRTLETSLGMQLKLKGTICINDPEAKFRASSKFFALQLLNQAGIPIPPTFLTLDLAHVESIVRDHLGAPLVVKMNEGTWGIGTGLAEDANAAQSMIKAAGDRNRLMLAQKYIKEAARQDIRVFVLGEQVIGAMRRVSQVDDFRANIHQGGKAEHVDLPEDYVKIALSAVRALELEIAGVDLIETETGPLVLEVNPSPGLQQIETITNIDIAAQIVKYLEKRQGAEPPNKPVC
jgi:ribosomal protein S6--L-glutamate ligase